MRWHVEALTGFPIAGGDLILTPCTRNQDDLAQGANKPSKNIS